MSSYVTLLADGAGGGWAFESPDGAPARVQPQDSAHVTVPLCDPACGDALSVARATVSLEPAVAAAFTAGTQPPQAELHLRAVLLLAVPAYRLAVAVGAFADTYAAHLWWATARERLHQPDMSIGVFPLIDDACRETG
ncbi:hypothetical protein AB0368_06650 [Actinoplanes sp. NPDC051475]|uniref:hypothetical protein n=1 Tax=Actinoplanes sp. NPDC051475 TaxID=3157225 RepID=UPI00344FFF85